MSTNQLSYEARVAQDYYDSEDANEFYSQVWGGEDIHIGLYDNTNNIAAASRATVDHMLAKLNLSNDQTILDIGCGYGGALRRILSTSLCRGVGVNLSQVENEQHRKLNQDQGFEHRIRILNASFENLPIEDNSCDVVWSQDALLHSGRRKIVLAEVSRVLKPGGAFVFTDPMSSDGVAKDQLRDILERIKLSDLATPKFYFDSLSELGFSKISFEERTHDLVKHYAAVLAETQRNESQLKRCISGEYLGAMKHGLKLWVEAGESKLLTWGIFMASLKGS